jgi:hypothetical protein
VENYWRHLSDKVMSLIKCLKELITDWLLFVSEFEIAKSSAVLSDTAAEA